MIGSMIRSDHIVTICAYDHLWSTDQHLHDCLRDDIQKNKLQKLEDALVKQMLAAADRADQAERDDWTDLAEVADWADRAVRADQADLADRADRTDRADWADRDDRADGDDRAHQADRADQADRFNWVNLWIG